MNGSVSTGLTKSLSFPTALMMRRLAAQLGTRFCRRNPVNVQSRRLCSSYDEKVMEDEAERKIGWLFKLIFAGTATLVGYNIFPYLGDNLMQQSVSLLRVKDPLFKRMGAARLTSFAIDDERRMKIIEIGGAKGLLNMLDSAKDNHTRSEALKAIAALAHLDEAIGALHSAGAISVIRSARGSVEDAEIEQQKSKLLERFQDLKYD